MNKPSPLFLVVALVVVPLLSFLVSFALSFAHGLATYDPSPPPASGHIRAPECFDGTTPQPRGCPGPPGPTTAEK